ncbi:competence protein CoiA family protein [Streptomyces sp. NPDC059866]|uniref:competence protein CoiA family protein n=1 Tax=Streptomyces sp. NPDC059866 TaxID=3346978 RepID=UPI00365F40D6
MPNAEEDTRKVQTAVSGHAGSDLPVYLPMDAGEFSAFISRYSQRAFFCGTLLGGCGQRLSPKQYRDRKCHFAHVSAAVSCGRTEGDEASADHLYIGRAIADWLKRQNQRAVQPVYKPKGHQVRDVIDVSYEAGRRLVRVQLARLSKREWEESDAELGARYAGLNWLFGPDSLLANWQIDRQGYALRVQCRSLGATREVEIGTQFPDRPVEWTSLSECSLTPEGIVTPDLFHTPSGIVPRHAVPATPALPASALPLTPASVLITDAVLSHATDTHRFFDISIRVNARLSLPAQAETPDVHHAYLPMGATLSLDSDGTWLIEARALHRIRADTTAQQKTDSGWPPADTHDPSPQEQPLPSDADIITSFRATLENAARSKNVVTMATLCRRASLHNHEFSVERWRELLVQVEQPRTPGKPILSALIKGRGGGPAPFFGEVLRGLGWTKDFSDAELPGIWDRERRRAHAAYSRSGPANPPPPPSHEARIRTSGRIGGMRADAAAARRATFDALLDLAHEARHAGDLDAFEQNLFLAERAAWSTDAHETVRGLTDWLVDRRGDELHEIWERLSALVDRLNREGDDLHPDQLRRVLRSAEELAEEIGEELAAEELRDIARWRQHLTRANKRLTLSEMRGHAVAVRVALRRTARAGHATTWGELALRIGAPLAALHPDDKVAVLVEADRETPDDRPLLSALITAHGADQPHPLYRQVLFNLDRPTPPPEALFMHWRMALRRHSELR